MPRIVHAVVSVSALLVGLSACGSGEFLKDPACAAPVTLLSQDLTNHLVNGVDNGTFVYAPAGGLVTTVTGSYDAQSGDFSWTELGAADAWFERAEVSGYGYADRSGDLDIVGERIVTDIRQLELREQFRISRVGCAMEKRIREWTASGEREDVETGIYLADSYRYEIERFGGSTERLIEGSRDTAGDYTETITEERSGYSLSGERTGNLGNGTWVLDSEESYLTRQGQVERSSVRERFPDGSRQVRYDEAYRDGSVVTYDYEIDYYGNGEGTISSNGGLSCSMTFTAGQCRYSCNSGQRGTCYAG